MRRKMRFVVDAGLSLDVPMSSYVYMKFLESAPERYDAGVRRLSGGAIAQVYERIAQLAGAAEGRRILDIGCGTGGVSLACAARGAQVVGIDKNAGMLEVARRKLAANASSGSAEFVELGAMEIEDAFRQRSFDAVVSCLVMSELLPEERKYVLQTARSRLREGGALVIADEVVPRARWQRAYRRLVRLPSEVLTYLLTQKTTRPIADLAGVIALAGFASVKEERLDHDGFAIVSAAPKEDP